MTTVLIDFQNGNYQLNGSAVNWYDLIFADPAFSSTFDIGLVAPGQGLFVDAFSGIDLNPVFSIQSDVFDLISPFRYLTITANYSFTMDLEDKGEYAGSAFDIGLSDFSGAVAMANIGCSYNVGDAFGNGANTSVIFINNIDVAPITNNGVPQDHTVLAEFDLVSGQVGAKIDNYPKATALGSFLGLQKIYFQPVLLGDVVDPPINNQTVLVRSITIVASNVSPDAGLDNRAPIEIGNVVVLPCFSPCLPYAIKRNR